MKTITKNKKAYYDYTIIDSFICGIVLKGTEVKLVRKNECSIKESYSFMKNDEIFLKNMHINSSKNVNKFFDHDSLRDKKLLLNKKEILKIKKELKVKGVTLIPLEILNTKSNLIKIKLGLCKGKRQYEKREVIKDRESKIRLNKINK